MSDDNFLWQARGRGPNGSEGVKVTRSLILVFDGANGERWRGAQIWADQGANWLARVQAEHSMVIDLAFDKSLFPGAIVGDAAVLRVTGGVDALTVEEAQASTNACPGIREEVACGNFFPAYNPRAIRRA